jgi:DUF4097 and DUF4098 domain-containing protein YvlB
MLTTTIVVGALSAAALLQQTDTTLALNGASRLSLENFRGEVVVRTWDRDAVQIRADYRSSRHVEIDRHGSTIHIEVGTDRGMGIAGTVDFQLTVPPNLDLSIEGMALGVDIEGSRGEVEVNTVNGNISLRGGRGAIDLESVNGEITVDGAEGDMDITGVAGEVTVRNSSGDIYVEGVGGSITLQGIRSSDIEAGTVGGSLRFEGAIQEGGVYTFGTHSGQIWLYLPEEMSARVEAVTLAGSIEIDYPGAPAEPTRSHGMPGLREKELTFETGAGSARIEVESFAGTIHILRAGGGM